MASPVWVGWWHGVISASSVKGCNWCTILRISLVIKEWFVTLPCTWFKCNLGADLFNVPVSFYPMFVFTLTVVLVDIMHMLSLLAHLTTVVWAYVMTCFVISVKHWNNEAKTSHACSHQWSHLSLFKSFKSTRVVSLCNARICWTKIQIIYSPRLWYLICYAH